MMVAAGIVCVVGAFAAVGAAGDTASSATASPSPQAAPTMPSWLSKLVTEVASAYSTQPLTSVSWTTCTAADVAEARGDSESVGSRPMLAVVLQGAFTTEAAPRPPGSAPMNAKWLMIEVDAKTQEMASVSMGDGLAPGEAALPGLSQTMLSASD